MTPKQEHFVLEYLVDLNATQAAIRSGYSAKTASQQGERLLRNVEVAEAVAAAKAQTANRLELSHEWVVQQALCQYRKADSQDRIRDAQQALDQIARLTGLDRPQKAAVIADQPERSMIDIARAIAFMLAKAKAEM